jgi:hypothetical protein
LVGSENIKNCEVQLQKRDGEVILTLTFPKMDKDVIRGLFYKSGDQGHRTPFGFRSGLRVKGHSVGFEVFCQGGKNRFSRADWWRVSGAINLIQRGTGAKLSGVEFAADQFEETLQFKGEVEAVGNLIEALRRAQGKIQPLR